MNSHSPTTEHRPVLIVGGGLAGLSAALFLAARGVSPLLVERHAASSPHPRAIGITTRSLELLRPLQLDPPIREVALGQERPRRVKAESLAGRWSDELAWTRPGPARQSDVQGPSASERSGEPLSPCLGAAIAQDELEPILRRRAIALGVDVRMSTRVTSIEQHADHVEAHLVTSDGRTHCVRADYVIAADGHNSSIRTALGISRSGHGVMRALRSVLFRAPLDEYLERGISQFMIEQEGLSGMLTTYRDGRWVLMFGDDTERDEATLLGLVQRAIGRSDVPVELITTGRWVLSAQIAETFSRGRVHLIGDAAHTLPPARGGYGANTGIEDAHNLAWKLAAVIAGQSQPRLLDTYDAERRPVAWLRHSQIFVRPDYAAEATELEKQAPVFADEAIELGQLYRSGSVIGASDELPPARSPEQWAGQPGTRAPHVEVRHGEASTSSVELLQRGWSTVAADPEWSMAA
ncbi:MAG TPA: FAD-dependent oxidoreductase, partial [Polyangiaceae bacterium]|nr:FAD-dependent oxidoreductase [Polyangiaceae bacterium]